MKSISTHVYAVIAAGGTITIPISNPVEAIRLYTIGSVTLVGNFSLTYSGTPREGYEMRVYCDLSNLTPDTFTVTLFGEPINETIIENTSFTAIARYSVSAGKFVVTVHPDFEGTAFIEAGHLASDAVTTAKILDNNVTLAKLVDFAARGYMLRGGVAGAPEEFDAKTSGQILIGNGTDITSVAVSGAVTISSTGVTTIGAGKVTASMLSFSLASYLEVTRTLTSAEILALRTTAIELLPAPGTNKYYELISVSGYNNYNTATYANGADLLNIECNGVALWTFPNAFTEAASTTASQGTRVADAVVAINTAINIRTSAADPTVGDGTIKISAIYRIITGE